MQSGDQVTVPRNRIKYIVLHISDLLEGQDPLRNMDLMKEYRSGRLVFINQRILESHLIHKKWKFFVLVDLNKKVIFCREGSIYPTSEIMGYFVFQICFGNNL